MGGRSLKIPLSLKIFLGRYFGIFLIFQGFFTTQRGVYNFTLTAAATPPPLASDP